MRGCDGLPSKVVQLLDFGGLKTLNVANILYNCRKVGVHGLSFDPPAYRMVPKNR